MKIEDNLPAALLERLGQPDFDDEAGFVIESSLYNNGVLQFILSLKSEEDIELWEVKIEHVSEYKITGSWVQDIRIYKTHPLLLNFTRNSADLYFKGSTEFPAELFFDIVQSLNDWADGLEEISKYFLTPEDIHIRNTWGYGLFFRGPKIISKIYQQCLQKHGINAYFVGSSSTPDEDSNFRLLLLEDSYVIGENISFQKQT